MALNNPPTPEVGQIWYDGNADSYVEIVDIPYWIDGRTLFTNNYVILKYRSYYFYYNNLLITRDELYSDYGYVSSNWVRYKFDKFMNTITKLRHMLYERYVKCAFIFKDG